MIPEIQEIIENNLPKQVGETLQKRLSDLEKKEIELEKVYKTIEGLNKTILEKTKEVNELKQLSIKERDLKTKAKQLAKEKQELDIRVLKIRLEESEKRTDLAKEYWTDWDYYLMEQRFLNERYHYMGTNVTINVDKVDNLTEGVQKAVDRAKCIDHEDIEFDVELLSDGYHSFKELYEFRKLYNAALFNEWAEHKTKYVEDGSSMDRLRSITAPTYDVHKSWKHNDGEWCFGKEKEWFIVVAILPTGQITNHYKAEDWDLFKIPETERAKYEYDGHTALDTIKRLKTLITNKTI